MSISLSSLAPNYRALVFGASGGIGAALVEALSADPRCGVVYAASRSPIAGVGKVHPLPFNLEDEASIAAAVAQASADGPLDLVLVATGRLHDEAIKPEKTFRAITPEALDKAFRINTTGPALIAKYALRELPRDRKAVFAALSARVGSISDNRLGGWHAYRASKAALNMLIRTFSIELALRYPKALCIALHPGTVDSRLSAPFQAGVPEGKLFTPERSATALLSVIDNLSADQTGKLFAWDGQEIPF